MPLTAHLEAGYARRRQSRRPLGVPSKRVRNLEDSVGEAPSSLAPIALQAEKILVVRETGAAAGVPLVLNARTDLYLAGVGEPASRSGETVKRLTPSARPGPIASCARSYRCRHYRWRERSAARLIYSPPAAPPPIGDLEKMGVRRVSVRSGPGRAAFTLMRRIGRELVEQGTYTSFTEGVMTYAEANRLLDRRFTSLPDKGSRLDSCRREFVLSSACR